MTSEAVDAPRAASAEPLREEIAAALTEVMKQWDAREVDATKRAGFLLGDFIEAMVAVFESDAAARRVADLAEGTRLRSMEFRNGRLNVELEAAQEITMALVASARTLLADAENYTELVYEVGAGGERYTLTLQRPGRVTAHEARLAAEAERDVLRAELELARSLRVDASSLRSVIDPVRHAPAKVRAFLAANGWRETGEVRGLTEWERNGETVAVLPDAASREYRKRMAVYVQAIATVHGTGELGVLADIAETEFVGAAVEDGDA